MSVTKEQIVENPDLQAAILTNAKPITDSMAASILKNPFIQAYIALAIADALNQGSP